MSDLDNEPKPSKRLWVCAAAGALALHLCGVALAVASSFRETRVNPHLIALGEVGLSGELRSVSQLERRLQEAANLGFKQALVPATLGRGMVRPPDGLTLVRVSSLAEAIEEALGR